MTLWTSDSLSTEFPRQEHWCGLPLPSPGDFPDPGIEPGSPALQAGSLPLSHRGSPTKAREQHKCASKAEWVKKMWYIDATEYYLAMEKNEIMPFYSNMDRSRDYHTR